MKKAFIFLFILLMPIKINAISASSAICMDLDTGRVLYGYNINEKRLIASTTKIMTAIVTIENSDLEAEIEVTDVIYKAFGSSIYIEVGEKIRLKDLLYGLMLRSGNDAALVIAEAVSGSKEAFVYLMNEYANNLKMENTIFYNPHGLEEENGDANISTALDMAKLTRYAMQNDIFREIFKTKKYTVKTNYKTYTWFNKNKLLRLDYITGGKTGFTELARRTLVSTGSKDNINLVVVTLNDPNDWLDHQNICYQVLRKDKFKVKNDYYKEKLYIKNDYYIALTKNELKKLRLNINLIKLQEYTDDTIVGYAEVILNNEVYHKEPIYIKTEKREEKISFWQKIKGWFSKW